MLADVGTPGRSRWQAGTGQSGQPGSAHYDDLIPGWRAGRSNPVYLDDRELRTAGGAKQLRIVPE
jgi:acyl-homoserine lactone acylase PvdQ